MSGVWVVDLAVTWEPTPLGFVGPSRKIGGKLSIPKRGFARHKGVVLVKKTRATWLFTESGGPYGW